MASLDIRLLLDDSAPLYPDDVAGCLLIEGDGQSTRTGYGSVDLWLLELAEGINSLERSPEVWVDLTGELESFRLYRDELGEGLQFCDASWRFPSGTIKKALMASVEEFLRAFKGFRPFAEEGALAQLAEWIDAQDQ